MKKDIPVNKLIVLMIILSVVVYFALLIQSVIKDAKECEQTCNAYGLTIIKNDAITCTCTKSTTNDIIIKSRISKIDQRR